MFNIPMQKEELKDAVRYEQLLQKEAVAPTQFEEAILTEDLAKSAGRLNIARIARNTNLQNAILDQLLKDDNLDAFNKNIDSFMKLLKNKKFTSLEQFKKDFAYFLDNQLLLPTKPADFKSDLPEFPEFNVSDLPELPAIFETDIPQNLIIASRNIDNEFRGAFFKKYGTYPRQYDKFFPKTKEGAESKKGTIITTMPNLEIFDFHENAFKDDPVQHLNHINAKKREYINFINKTVSEKRERVPESSAGATSEAVSSGTTSSGSGLIFPLKKKSTHIRYR